MFRKMKKSNEILATARVALGIDWMGCKTCKYQGDNMRCFNMRLAWPAGWEKDPRFCYTNGKVSRYPGWAPRDE